MPGKDYFVKYSRAAEKKFGKVETFLSFRELMVGKFI
jgi:hypothetical protein